MARFEDKVVVITGAASGIGLELATLLAREKACLSLADSRLEALDRAAQQLVVQTGCKLIITAVDVRKRGEIESWIQKTIDEFGRIDGAANLAGVIGESMGTKTIAEFDNDDEWDFVMGVNSTGV